MPIRTNENEEDRPSPQQQRELFGGDSDTAAVAGGIPCLAVAPSGMPPPHLPVQPPGVATWTNTLRAMVDNMSDEMREEFQREMTRQEPIGGATAVTTPPRITPTTTGQRQVTVLLPGQTTP